MSQLFDRLRAALPNAIFYPPATEEQIARVEAALSTPFPDWLRSLYLCCNGIHSEKHSKPYLYALESNDDFRESLLSWNQFNRELWNSMVADLKYNQPGPDWDALDIRFSLLIGGLDGIDWAIDPKNGPQILRYDVRNPDDREVIGMDLVAACIKNEQEIQMFREEQLRGRQPHFREGNPNPQSCDVELVEDMLISLHGGSMGSSLRGTGGWRDNLCPYLYQAISQRPGETGKLFIFHSDFIEIQVATRDGNLPFMLRAKVATQDMPLRCLVRGLPETLFCMLYVIAHLNPFRIRDNAEFTDWANHAAKIWSFKFGMPDPELEQMATILFDRDDRRMQEENPMGE